MFELPPVCGVHTSVHARPGGGVPAGDPGPGLFPTVAGGEDVDPVTPPARPLVVSTVVADGVVVSFGLGVTAEVFGYDRTHLGLPRFDFALVTERSGEVRSDTGTRLLVDHGLERLAWSDIVTVTSWELIDATPSQELLAALRAATSVAPSWSASAPAPSCSPTPGCSTAPGPRPTGAGPGSWRPASPR